MRRLLPWLLLAAGPLLGGEGLDRLGEALSFASPDGALRARLSGALEWEDYWFEAPAPALLRADSDHLAAPRLAFFLDTQLGGNAYAFAQARVDRGFDPGNGPLRGRLDEFALRLTTPSHRLSLQAGKFATVVGNWVGRHDSWSNPLISAPLPYENLTGIFDAAAATTLGPLLRWGNVGPGPFPAEEYLAELRVPIIWGPVYATGAAVFGTAGRTSFALEVKNASPSSRPSQWTLDGRDFSHPTVSARISHRPDAAWQFGVSASAGSYLTPEAGATVAPGHGLGDYQQYIVAGDLGYAWHHLQVWAEVFASRFTIPRVGNADTVAYYVEARCKVTPQLALAARWNQQFYGTVGSPSTRWGRDTWRIEFAPAYRLTPHLQLKLQYGLQHRPIVRRSNEHVVASQLVLRF